MANSVHATEGPLPLPPATTRALQILLQANEYATDCAVDIWQFAVELSDLLTAGMTRLDLRWLLCRQFVEHACETTVPGDAARQFRRLPLTSIPEGTCFVLTASGVTALRSTTSAMQQGQQSVVVPRLDSLPSGEPSDLIDPRVGSESPWFRAGNSQPENDSLVIPVWNSNLRELRFQGDLVKKFRVPAANQEMILSVFQEEGGRGGLTTPCHLWQTCHPSRGSEQPSSLSIVTKLASSPFT